MKTEGYLPRLQGQALSGKSPMINLLQYSEATIHEKEATAQMAFIE